MKTESNSVKASSQKNNATEAAGLIAWYPFNGNTLDSSGHGNNVVFQDATATIGKNGVANNAYYFNGVTNYMRVANSASLNPTHAITMYALIRPQGFYQGVCHSNRVISKGFNDLDVGRYDLGFDDAPYYNFNQCSMPVASNFEQFYGYYGDTQVGATVIGGYAKKYIQVNHWYKVTCTYDGSVGKIYINGEFKGKVVKNIVFTPNSQDLYIARSLGSFGQQYPYYFNGTIDEIKIYNRALSAAEVAAL